MRFSIITPNYNGAVFLETTILSVLNQKQDDFQLEYIIIDGGSTDGSIEIIEKHRKNIDILLIEKDTGPANAINKGFARATGEVLAWLNADDIYYPDTFIRVKSFMENQKMASFCFGKCPVINERGEEIRRRITRFKELFFPISSRFVFQTINYISQPSVFFRRSNFDGKKPFLREDLVAAWDYEFFLRLWSCGNGGIVPGGPLAAFRWHESSISGQNFNKQFQEEYHLAKCDAGAYAPQASLHFCVRWGIVLAYSIMTQLRKSRK
jgi:glycosyltransferase involved in cell wall biosynthesis